MKKVVYGYCRVSIAPVRSEAKDSAEMVTQLLFGEPVALIDEDRQWRKTRNLLDAYEGWVDEKMIEIIGSEELETWREIASPNFHPHAKISVSSNNMILTRGALLPQTLPNSIFEIDTTRYCLKSKNKTIPTDIAKIALAYLNTPYLWGGRSNFGIDCSGLTQMIYRFKGYALPRDAYQQAEYGREVTFENKAKGDLAFFENDSGKITHVGMVLENNQIIHAHGQVIIDELKKEGIYSEKRELFTHKLCLIKRYF